MMKKLYSAPLMEVEKFDVETIITTSDASTAEKIQLNEAKDGYEVIIQSKW